MHVDVLDVCLLLASLALWLDNPHCAFKAVLLLASCPQGANFSSCVLSRISTKCKVHVTQTHTSCCYGKAINASLILFLFLYHLLPCYACRCAECLHCLCHLLFVSFCMIHSKEVCLSGSCLILFMENKIFIKLVSTINIKKFVTLFFSPIRGLRSIPSLSQFRRLRYLWINNNKVIRYSFKEQNNASILPDYYFVVLYSIKYYIYCQTNGLFSVSRLV